jgi:predicted transcriptional regulator
MDKNEARKFCSRELVKLAMEMTAADSSTVGLKNIIKKLKEAERLIKYIDWSNDEMDRRVNRQLGEDVDALSDLIDKAIGRASACITDVEIISRRAIRG